MDAHNSTRPEPSKCCTKCGDDKPLTEYHRQSRTADGRAYQCKACKSAYRAGYYVTTNERANNIDRERTRIRAYYAANRERLRLHRAAYHAERFPRDPEYRARRSASQIRRNRLKASAVQEPYNRVDIFERDAWVCQLCNEPVNPDLRAPDPLSASIDHRVPLSLGGDDTPANVQLAHFGCNSGKCNRVEVAS